jgi:hypothetical protein
MLILEGEESDPAKPRKLIIKDTPGGSKKNYTKDTIELLKKRSFKF